MSDLQKCSKPIVTKFGGTSLATTDTINKVCRILEDNPERRVIVVSAPGKSLDNPHKVTDMLIDLVEAYYNSSKGDVDLLQDKIVNRYSKIYPNLDTGFIYDDLLEIFSDNKLSSDQVYAHTVSRGEYWNARLFAQNIGAEFVDSDELILIKPEKNFRNGKIDANTFDNIQNKLGNYFDTVNSQRIVIPGFYGTTLEGNICLLGRGGSDRTGSIIAAGINADLYENFTDGPILCANPDIIPQSKIINEVTYKELRDLSYSGFSVIHPQTLQPLINRSIPLCVRSTFKYPERGTLVTADRVSNENNPIVGIAYKDGFCSFSIEADGINESVGVLSSLLDVFVQKMVSIEFVAQGIDDISIIVTQDYVKHKVDEIQAGMYKVVENLCDDGIINSTFRDNLGSLVVAGKGISQSLTAALEVEKLLVDKKIDVLARSMGLEKRCLIYMIKSSDSELAVKSLYQRFIE